MATSVLSALLVALLAEPFCKDVVSVWRLAYFASADLALLFERLLVDFA
jgi:hypothetical protein